MENKEIQAKELLKWLKKGKYQRFIVQNTQTGNVFQFKVSWAEVDPLDHNNSVVPQYVFSCIGDREDIFIGSIYDGDDFRYSEYSTFPADYPAVKIFRFVYNSLLAGKSITHMRFYAGEILLERAESYVRPKGPYAEFEAEEQEKHEEWLKEVYGDRLLKRREVKLQSLSIAETLQLQFGNSPDARMGHLFEVSEKFTDTFIKRKASTKLNVADILLTNRAQ